MQIILMRWKNYAHSLGLVLEVELRKLPPFEEGLKVMNPKVSASAIEAHDLVI
jgi:hypothetical protein